MKHLLIILFILKISVSIAQPKKTVDLRWKIGKNEKLSYVTIMNELDTNSIEMNFGIFKSLTDSSDKGLKESKDFFKRMNQSFSNQNFTSTLTNKGNGVIDIVLATNSREDEPKSKKNNDDKTETEIFKLMQTMNQGVMLRGSVYEKGGVHSFWVKNSQKNLIALLFELPSKPVKIGDKWSLDINFVANDQNFVCDSSYKLNEVKLIDIKKSANDSIAVLQYNIIEYVKGAFNTPAFLADDSNKETMIKFIHSGIAEFSITKGRWLIYDGIMSVETTGFMSGNKRTKFALIPPDPNQKTNDPNSAALNKKDLENINKQHQGIILLHKIKESNTKIHQGIVNWAYLYRDDNNRNLLLKLVNEHYPQLKNEFSNQDLTIQLKQKLDSIFRTMDTTIKISSEIMNTVKTTKDYDDKRKRLAIIKLTEELTPLFYQADTLVSAIISSEESEFQKRTTELKNNSLITLLEMHKGIVNIRETKETTLEITLGTLYWMQQQKQLFSKTKLKKNITYRLPSDLKKISSYFKLFPSVSSDRARIDSLIYQLRSLKNYSTEIMNLLTDDKSYEDIPTFFIAQDTYESSLYSTYFKVLYDLDYYQKNYEEEFNSLMDEEIRKVNE